MDAIVPADGSRLPIIRNSDFGRSPLLGQALKQAKRLITSRYPLSGPGRNQPDVLSDRRLVSTDGVEKPCKLWLLHADAALKWECFGPRTEVLSTAVG